MHLYDVNAWNGHWDVCNGNTQNRKKKKNLKTTTLRSQDYFLLGLFDHFFGQKGYGNE